MVQIYLKITLEHIREPLLEEIIVRPFSQKDNTETDFHNINSYIEVEGSPSKQGMAYHFKEIRPFNQVRDVWYLCKYWNITEIKAILQEEEE